MGVLACDRAGCEAIMCHITIAHRFYACTECYHELEEAVRRWPEGLNRDQVIHMTDQFFRTTKTLPPQDNPETKKVFESLVELN
jgi:hypothetical protein